MNIGIVGCGNIARSHAAILKSNISDARLIFCDRDKNKANNLARRFFPGSTYATIDELLTKEKLDTVHILTQVQNHTTLAEKAFAAGAHVYIEKPVTDKASEYTALLALAKSKNRHLCAGYSTLGMPAVRRAKDIVNSGRFGRLITVHCDFNWSAHGNAIPYGSLDHWAYSLQGGILQNIADHPTSVIIDAMDEIRDHNMLFVRRNQLPNNRPDLLHVSVSNYYQIGSCTVSFGHGNTHGQVTYCLETATVLVDLRRQLLAIITGKGPQNFYRKTLSGLKLSWDIGGGIVGYAAKRLTGSLHREPGIVGLVRNFYRVIDGKEALIVSEATATRITALLEHIWEELDAERVS